MAALVLPLRTQGLAVAIAQWDSQSVIVAIKKRTRNFSAS
jgi:hypothetical protein